MPKLPTLAEACARPLKQKWSVHPYTDLKPKTMVVHGQTITYQTFSFGIKTQYDNLLLGRIDYQEHAPETGYPHLDSVKATKDALRLILAAPDLLKAAQDFLRADNTVPVTPTSIKKRNMAIGKLHAAVRKATVLPLNFPK